jgi:hypothetical protein
LSEKQSSLSMSNKWLIFPVVILILIAFVGVMLIIDSALVVKAARIVLR